ncbi:hypothetical protein HPB50_029196 [Hyalomma asiaticum]|nr:hypothetical protein HPB50_029196 [Hyalomma asiaticum]
MDGTCCKNSEVVEAEEGCAAVDASPSRVLEVLNMSLPTKQWAKHVFSENPLHVAYSVCLPGKDLSLLHALKMVVFRSIESVIQHEVFVRGVEVALDVPSNPASILQEIGSLSACTGAGLSAEFPLACSNANLKQ